MAEVVLENIYKSFGNVKVIHGVDLKIDHGDFVVFVGPSGCGKSTLLRLVAGLEDITEGNLYIDKALCNEKPPRDRGIAMVFQSYALYPHMTVFDNMAFSMKLEKRPKEEIREKVGQVAQILQMEHLLDRKPAALSGGQRQRVAIGRAIVRNPKVFLFDEPLSNLDASLRGAMRIEIAKLHHELDTTMIYVTHDQVEAMTLADKIVVLQDGIVEQYGTPMELYHCPQNMFVASFIGSPKMNFIKTTIHEITKEGVSVNLPGSNPVLIPVEPHNHISAGAPVTLGIRPEHLNETNEGNASIATSVSVVERLGNETIIYATTEDNQPVSILTEGTSTTAMGTTIQAGFDSENCHLFDEKEQAFKRKIVPDIVNFGKDKFVDRATA